MRGSEPNPALAILSQKLLHSPDVLDFERIRMLTDSNCRGDIDAMFALLAGLFASISDTDISIVERTVHSRRAGIAAVSVTRCDQERAGNPLAAISPS
jgi:hypothetical protein